MEQSSSINGQNYSGGSSQTFNGSYRGKPVMARVTKVVTFLSERYIVDVFYNRQLIETTSL